MKKALTDVKSFVTILMTITLCILLFAPIEVDKEILIIFSTAYGSIITYFFTRKSTDNVEIKEEK